MIGKPRKRRRLNIAAIPDCEWWIDCARTETLTFASGDNVSQVADLSGHNRHMTKTGAGNETTYPTYSAVEKALFFNNSVNDQMIAGSIGDWNFLHDGSGATVLMLLKVDTGFSADGVILADMTDESNQAGMMLFYRNTNQNFQYTVRNPSGGFVFAASGSAGTLTKGDTKLVSLFVGSRTGSPHDFVSRVNGATNTRTDPSSTYSSANPPATLFIGKYPAAGSKCRMYLKKCAIFSRRLRKAEENRILREWAREENISLTTYPERDLAVLSGQSNATGQGAIAGTEFDSEPIVTDARIFNFGGTAWNAPLQAGVNNLGNSASLLGMEMKLAREFIARSGRVLDIVKYASNNTSLTDWEEGDTAFVTLKSRMQTALWELEDSGYTVRPFFIWYQGEADSLDADKAAQYETRLKAFLDAILATEGYTQCPVYLIQTDQNPDQVGTATVQQAQMNVAMTLPYSAHVHHVETLDIITHIDTHHVDGPSQCAIGERVARRVLGVAE